CLGCNVQSDIISSNLRDAQRQNEASLVSSSSSMPLPSPAASPISPISPSSSIPLVSPTSSTLQLETQLINYIQYSKEEGQKHGFNLQTEIKRVLAIEGIILLKKGQHCQKLEALISPESLLNRIRDEVMDKSVKFDNVIARPMANVAIYLRRANT
ncbi:hypothetical protein EC973_009693, partial [Apophysomyces ossiformis]